MSPRLVTGRIQDTHAGRSGRRWSVCGRGVVGRPAEGHVRHRHDDTGAATMFVLGVAVSLFAMAGLVVDGGLAINARQRVADDTEQAARAGADRLAEVTLRGDGSVLVDPTKAQDAARTYLLGRGYTDAQISVSVNGDHVQVAATRQQPTTVLSIVFINSFTVSGQADARAAIGITGEITGGLP